MYALWLENRNLTLRKNEPKPPVPSGEALVKVLLAGICGTDLELVRGYYPFSGIPGHEFVGQIVECPCAPHRVGRRVVGEINAWCGECPVCRSGRPTHCPSRTVLGIVNRDGVFAEYMTLPERNLMEVPDEVPDEQAVYVEPLAAALQIQEQLSIDSEEPVLVIGAGRLGQLIVRVLGLQCRRLTVVTRYPNQTQLLESLDVDCLSAGQVPDREWGLVVEATGSPGGLDLALKAIRPRGTIALKSTYHGLTQVDFSRIVVDELTLVGSRCGPFRPAIQLLRDKRVNPTPLTEAVYPLSRGLEAFEASGLPGAMKILLECGSRGSNP